jgi:signal transduction histidine kinase
LEALAGKRPAGDAQAVVDALAARLEDLLSGGSATADVLLEAELDADRMLGEARVAYALSPPIGFGLTTDLRRDWDYLKARLDHLEDEVFAKAARKMAMLVNAARKDAAAGPDRRQRLVQFVERTTTDAKRRTADGADEARAAAELVEHMVHDMARQSLETVDDVAGEALAAVQDRGNSLASDAAYVKRRLDLEQRLTRVSEQESDLLRQLAERLRRAASMNGTGSGRPPEADLTALLEEEVLELRDRAERDFELAQLGMATQVISHELDATIVEVRAGLKRLGAWADVNPQLGELESDLRTAFDHLDGYLSLFAPLQRRLRRRREQITGANIEKFLMRLFERRLEQLSIELRVTQAFREWQTVAFRSELYPVFINLIDNATYWVRQESPPYWIELDADSRGLLVEDSGPGVPERDREVIWEYGFSRKPGGRGAGLHISREVLSREGWRIEVVSTQEGSAFLVTPPEGDEEGHDEV